MKFAFHIHSKYSYDSISSIKSILKMMYKYHIDSVAITDHESFLGVKEALSLQYEYRVNVIPAIEINTEVGDLIGLFLTDEITSRKSEDVITDIHKQHGLVILPHPYRNHQLKQLKLKNIDVIEVFNSRSTAAQNTMAIELAQKYRKPAIVGSDAHFTADSIMAVNLYADDLRDDLTKDALNFITYYTPQYKEQLSQAFKSYRVRDYKLTARHLFKFGKSLL